MKISQHIRNLRRKMRNLLQSSGVGVSLAYGVYRLICGTLRYTEHRENIKEQDEIALARKNGEIRESKPVIFCVWHDEIFPLMKVRGELDLACIVSPSKDGAILENLLHRGGVRTVKGSSRRDGLKALLMGARMMQQEGVHICITPDGPMGPRHKVKDGIFLLAKKGEARIVPMRVVMHNAIRFSSWDRFQIPLPFSRVEAHFAPGFFVTEELTEENLQVYRDKLESEMEKLAPSQE